MDRNAPADPSWVVAIYESPDSAKPLGAGVILTADRILTCAHVLAAQHSADAHRDHVWIAFPWADGWMGPRISASIEAIRPRIEQDAALLRLDQRAPAGVRLPVPIKCPRPQDLAGKRWWSFGFPAGDPIGAEARGTVSGALSYDWMQLEHDPQAASFVGPGYSGTGLWVPEYGVVGLVGQANPVGRSARAISLHRLDQLLPEAKIRVHARWSAVEAGESALAAWGWALADDPEAGQHWRPRARGVAVESERGFRFRGRTAALTRIKDWLDRPFPDSRALVVTGSPGSGKSAVLGRIVTTADAAAVKALPPDDHAVRATLGSVGCAVHAKGKTALDVAREIARAASAPLPEQADQIADHLRDTLSSGPRAPFNIVIDALDEAAGTDQATEIVRSVVHPLLESCTEFGVQIVVGTRRDLLGQFGESAHIIDLDDTSYVAMDDLTAYATATLQLLGAERVGNPYQDAEIAEPVAERIAYLADRNFLVAGLVARTHGMYDETAVDPADIHFTPTVASALAEYVRRLPDSDRLPVRWALTALAFAEAPGFTIELWRLALRAISGIEASEEALSQFAQSPAANFLIESAHGVDKAYRLYHQALDDTLLAARAQQFPRDRDEAAIFDAFTECGRASQWKSVPEYLLRALPSHAAAANRVDDLLMDEDYLLRADLRRVVGIAELAQSPQGEIRAQLLRQTPQEADESSPYDRAAMFSVTEQLEGLGDAFALYTVLSPYTVAWAETLPAADKAATFLSNWRATDGGIAPVTVAGRTLLAVANGGAVWLWDPLSGRCEQQLGDPAAAKEVIVLLPIRVDGRTLLASVHDDWRVRLWDVENQSCRHGSGLDEDDDWVESAVVIEIGGRDHLAVAGGAGKVRIWDPSVEGYVVTTTVPRHLWQRVRGVRNPYFERPTVVTIKGRPHVAVGDGDGFVYLFDPVTRTWTSRRAFSARKVFRLRGRERLFAITAVDEQSVAVEGSSGLWLLEPATGRRTLLRSSADVDGIGELAAIGSEARTVLIRYAERTIQVWETSPWRHVGAFSQRMGVLADARA